MKIDLKNCTTEELWTFVAIHLKKGGIDTVLVGGAVVSIYSNGAYQSGDLDFVLSWTLIKKLEDKMNEIGFVKQGGRHYIHPECSHLFVEFNSGPLEIGDDTNIFPVEKEIQGITIKLLSPTDCVKDRLAAYIYFKSQCSFDQALLVANRHPINFHSLKKWLKAEKQPGLFKEFCDALKLV